MPERPRSRADFDVAIICALGAEVEAVHAVFDETWDAKDGYGKVPGDQNAYTTGSIGQHNVVLASMPGIGKAAASGVAASMRSSFPSIRLCLLVGICGGVPELAGNNEVLLGDVVVSTGIVQFDLRRRFPDGPMRKNTLQDNLGRPNSEIRAFLAKLGVSQNHTALQGKTSQYATEILQNERFKHSRYPGVANDKLYPASYRHKHQKPTTCSICAQCQSKDDKVCDIALEASCTTLQCSNDMLVPRSRLMDLGGRKVNAELTVPQGIPLPIIHFGRVASGDEVMKSGEDRDEIAHEENVIAFEMEGAGVWGHLPTIIVKSVCDYADCHKNKFWQSYAAVTAAACTKAILRQWSVVDRLPGPYHDHALTPYQTQSALVNHTSLVPREAWSVELSGLDRWAQMVPRISDYNHEKAHRILKKPRVDGTTEWFLKHQIVKSWLEEPDRPSLWCSGKIGCGKTIICTRLVDEIKRICIGSGAALIFFYCDGAQRRPCKAAYLLASLIKQLLEYMAIICKPYSNEIKRKILMLFTPAAPEPDLEDLIDIFFTIFPLVSEAWYIVDGLDQLESNEISNVLQFLYPLTQNTSQRKLFIASRDQLDPNTRISTLRITSRISILESDVKNDIYKYIDARIRQNMDEKRVLTHNAELLNQIKARLLKESHGMFLWVRLQVDAIWSDCFSDMEIEQALENLPPDLFTTYVRCLDRIPMHNIPRARKTFRWIICASRSLTIRELKEAVSFGCTDLEWSQAKIIAEGIIMSSCTNLIELDANDQTVRIIHPTVRSFLCSSSESLQPEFRLDFDKATIECGEECINYLSFSNFELQLESRNVVDIGSIPGRVLSSSSFSNAAAGIMSYFVTNKKMHERKNHHINVNQTSHSNIHHSKYEFLEYARLNWAVHTKKLSSKSRVWPKFEELVLGVRSNLNFHPWNPNSLSQGSRLHSLLAFASRERHLSILKLLIQQKSHDLKQICDIPFVKDGLPALHAASRLGFEDVVTLLLTICKPGAYDKKNWTALHYAAEKNHIEVAKALLSVGSGWKLQNTSDLATPPGVAARGGFAEMTSLLLDAILWKWESHGNIEPIPPDKNLALHESLIEAAKFGHANVVQMILFKYNKTIRENYRLEAFLQAMSKKHEESAELLLQSFHKRDFLEADRTHKFLILATESKLERILKLLLEQGYSDIYHRDGSGRTALIVAAESGFTEGVQLLLERSEVQVNAQDYWGSTALMGAIVSGDVEVVRLLLQHGDIQVDLRNNKEETALMQASSAGQAKAINILLKHRDVQVNLQDNFGRTALIRALNIRETGLLTVSKKEHAEALNLLLKHPNIQVNMQDKNGYTALMHTSSWGHAETVNLLLKHSNIQVNIQDTDGDTALIKASSLGHAEIVDLLLKHPNIQVNMQDNNGDTALMLASSLGDAKTVDVLLKHSNVQVNIQDADGKTALMHASSWGHAETVDLLLKHPSIQVNIQDTDERTALMLAAQFGDRRPGMPLKYVEAIKLLLRHRHILVNIKNKKGQTALSLAVVAEDVDTVELLLERSDIEIDDVALKTAKKIKDKTIWRLLQDYANRVVST